MPDPFLYGKALAVSFLASVLFVFLLRRCLSRESATGNALAEILGVAGAAVLGLALLHIRPRLPPQNGLDRLLLIVLPAALGIELAATMPRLAGTPTMLLRCLGSAAFGWVLLYGSVHLRPAADSAASDAVWPWLILWGIGLFVAWERLSRFVRRTRDVAVPLALALATLSAGLIIMMAGYLKGGSTAFPLAAAIGGAAWWGRYANRPGALTGVTGLAVVALFGLLMIGRYFGGLTTAAALVVFAAPWLAWLPELLEARDAASRKRVLWRLVAVLLLLGLVLFRAKLAFDQKFAGLSG